MGSLPEDPAMVSLKPLVAHMQTTFTFLPVEEDVVRFGREAARIVVATRPVVPKPVASGSGWSSNTLRRRLVTPLAASVLLVGLTGVAFAANDSAPDDALYGLDRALEVVGIGNGGAAERIAEAQAMFSEGKVAAAVEHAAEAAELSGDPEAAAATAALLRAADRLRADVGSEASLDVNERVASMLEWMANTDMTGSDFGHGVAERAGGLAAVAGSQGQGGPAPQSEDKSGNSPDGTGPPDHAQGGGPPASPGGGRP